MNSYRVGLKAGRLTDDSDFEIHSLFNRKLMGVISERRRYVVELSQFSDQTCSSVQGRLQFV